MNLEGYSNQFIEYYNYHKKYEKQFGEDTIVLLQNGSFFEVYSQQLDDGSYLGVDIHKVSKILNMLVTKKDKSKPLSKSNFLMLGFPIRSKVKNANIFLNHNYHVIIVEQVTEPPKPVREVTEILSPGTKISEYDDTNQENILMSIFIEKSIFKNRDIYSAGLSLINVATGHNNITDTIENYEDEDFIFNEIKRYINYYNPVEVIIHTKDFDVTKDQLIKTFDLMNSIVYHNIFSDKKDLLLVKFQNEILQNIFDFSSQYSPIENLDLERKQEVLLSYIYLLNYISIHNKILINNIDYPEKIDNVNYLVLSNDSVRQLNICENYSFYKGSNKDLLSLLNKCSSIIGKRTYKNRLLFPSIDTDIINNRYDIVEILINEELYDKIKLNFNRINDYEKSIRNMGLQLLTPILFYSDYLTYEYLLNNIELVQSNEKLNSKYQHCNDIFSKFKEYYNEVSNTFEFQNFTTLSNNNDIQKSIFKKELFTDLDNLDQEINKCLENYDIIIKKLSKIIDPKKNTDLVKLDFTDKFNWFLQCTTTRSKQIVKYLNKKDIIIKDNDNNIICELTKDNLSIKKRDSSNSFIMNDSFTNISKKLINLNKNILSLNKKYFDNKIQELYSKYKEDLKKINLFIGDLDCNSNNAFISIKNNYFKPTIDKQSKSFVNIKELRHPIAEQINKTKEFIKNDIHLGINNQSGILLYGLNSSGKSTTSKAIALCLVMAQCGCYVPASEFVYSPYTQIFTRILNNDKLWSGLSSFAVECKEISHILNNANNNSFVIGDEIFSSTESDSAISLVSGVIQILHKIDCSFIFATHFHELMELDDIKSLINNNLKIYHLSVKIDKNVLYFNRILKEGNGPTDYGIIVGKSLGLPDELINIANKTKNEINKISDTFLCNKTSNYNSNIVMRKCSMPNCNCNAEETHHIKEQKDADQNGNIGSIHKNDQHNLCPLCKTHHAEITYGKLLIKGYLDTSEGLKLDYEYCDLKKNKKKFDNSQISIIKSYNSEFSNILTKKDIINKIKSEKNIDISITIFNRIIKDQY